MAQVQGYLPLPNGSLYPVMEGVTDEEAWATAQRKYPEAFRPKAAEPPPATGGLAAIKKGWANLTGSTQTAAGALFGDATEAARAGVQRGEDAERKYANQTSMDAATKAYEDAGGGISGAVDFAKTYAKQVPYALAEQLPNMAATLGGAKLGAMAGSLAGPVGTVVGGVAGAVLPSALQHFGGNLERQVQEGATTVDTGAAALATAPQAALDTAAAFIPLGGSLVKKLTGIPVEKIVGGVASKSAAALGKQANEKLLQALAKGAGVGVLAEVPTEVVQQMLERAQAGLDLVSPDALKEYGQAAYTASQVGGPLGGAGRVYERGSAKDELDRREKLTRAQEAKAAADAEAARKADPGYPAEIAEQFESAGRGIAEVEARMTAQFGGYKDKHKNALKGDPEKYDAFLTLNEERNKLIGVARELRPEYHRLKPQIDQIKLAQRRGTDAWNAEAEAGAPAARAATAEDPDVQRDMFGAALTEQLRTTSPLPPWPQSPEALDRERAARLNTLSDRRWPAANAGAPQSAEFTQAEEEYNRLNAPNAAAQEQQRIAQLGALQTQQAGMAGPQQPGNPLQQRIDALKAQAQRPEMPAESEVSRLAQVKRNMDTFLEGLKAQATAAHEKGDRATRDNLYAQYERIDIARQRLINQLKQMPLDEQQTHIAAGMEERKLAEAKRDKLKQEHEALQKKLDEAVKAGAVPQVRKLQEMVDAKGAEMEAIQLPPGQEPFDFKGTKTQKSEGAKAGVPQTARMIEWEQEKEKRSVAQAEQQREAAYDAYDKVGPQMPVGEPARRTGREIESIEQQAAMDHSAETQQLLFAGPGAQEVEGKGAPEQETRSDLLARVQIAKAASMGDGRRSDRMNLVSAISALRDFDSKPNETPPVSTAETQKAAGMGYVPAGEFFASEARDGRNAALTAYVGVLEKFHRGAGDAEGLAAARQRLEQQLVAEIEHRRKGEELTAAERANALRTISTKLDELQDRWGDTREAVNVGTKKKPVLLPAISQDGIPLPDTGIEGPTGMGLSAVEMARPGAQTFPDRFAAAVDVQRSMNRLVDQYAPRPAVAQHETTRADRKIGEKEVVAAVDRALQNKALAPEARALLEQVGDEWSAVVQDTGREDTADASSFLQQVAQYAHRAGNTGEHNDALAAPIVRRLRIAEQGKRSEAETPTRETAWGTATQPTRYAQQMDMFQSKEQGRVFDSAADFQQFLGSESLNRMRNAMGLFTSTMTMVHNQMQPAIDRVRVLSERVQALQEKEQNAQRAARMSERGAAYEMEGEARAAVRRSAELQKMEVRLAKERSALDAAAEAAQNAFKFASNVAQTISWHIADGVRRFTDSNVNDLLTAVDDAKKALAARYNKPISKENWDAMRGAQRRVVAALQAAADDDVAISAAIRRFVDHDLKYQLQLQEELSDFSKYVVQLSAAKFARDVYAEKQERRPVTKRIRSEAKVSAAVAETQVAEAAALADELDAARNDPFTKSDDLRALETQLAEAEKKVAAQKEAQARARADAKRADEVEARAADRRSGVKEKTPELSEDGKAVAAEQARLERLQGAVQVGGVRGEAISFEQRAINEDKLAKARRRAVDLRATLKKEGVDGDEAASMQADLDALEQLTIPALKDLVEGARGNEKLNASEKKLMARVAAIDAKLNAGPLPAEARDKLLAEKNDIENVKLPRLRQRMDKRSGITRTAIRTRAQRAEDAATGHERLVAAVRAKDADAVEDARRQIAEEDAARKAADDAGAGEQTKHQAAPVTRKAVQAGNIRTGDTSTVTSASRDPSESGKSETSQKARTLSTRNSPQQERGGKLPTSKQVERAANKDTGGKNAVSRGEYLAGLRERVQAALAAEMNKKDVDEARVNKLKSYLLRIDGQQQEDMAGIALETYERNARLREETEAKLERLEATKRLSKEDRDELNAQIAGYRNIEQRALDEYQRLSKNEYADEGTAADVDGAVDEQYDADFDKAERKKMAVEQNKLLAAEEKKTKDREKKARERAAKAAVTATNVPADIAPAVEAVVAKNLGSLPDSTQAAMDAMVNEGGARYAHLRLQPGNEATQRIAEAVDGMGTVEAAQWLADNATTQDRKDLAASIASTLSDMGATGKVAIVDKAPTSADGKKGAGAYDTKTGNVQAIGNNAALEETLLHELEHAATVAAADMTVAQVAAIPDAGLRNRVAKLQTDLNNLLDATNEALQDAKKGETTGIQFESTADTAELLAYGRTNPEFMAFLQKTPYKKEGVSLLQKLWQAVKRFFGLRGGAATAFDEVVRLSTEAKSVAPQLAQMQYISVDKDGEVRFAHGTAATPSWNPPEQVTKGIDSLVAKRSTLRDKVQALSTGFRTTFIDSYDETERALSAGEAAGATKHDTNQVRYFLRFGAQRNHHIGSAMTNGPLSLRAEESGHVTYESKEGPNLIKVADALREGGFGGFEKAIRAFTMYEAGMRAKQAGVGWEKLNYADKSITKGNYEALQAYLETMPQAKAALEKAHKVYQAYNRGLIDFLAETGGLSKEKASILRGRDFVPYYRKGNIELFVAGEHPIRIGNLNDAAELHELVGDDAQILDAFTSAMKNTATIVTMATKNMAVRSTAMQLQKMGMAEIGTGDGPSGNHGNVLRFMENGAHKYAIVEADAFGVNNALLVKGMEGIPTALPEVVKLMAMPADWLRKFVTRNPAYAARQLVRDPWSAAFTTGAKFTPVVSSVKKLVQMAQDKDPTTKVLEASGAVGSNVYSGRADDLQTLLQNIVDEGGGFNKIMHKLDRVAVSADVATRAAIYEALRRDGMDHMEALLATVESMNFTRRGLSPSMHMLSSLIPFFNAQVQGLDLLYRAARGKTTFEERMKVQQKFWRNGAYLAGTAMLYSMAMGDDEAYKNAPPEVRYGNFFVPFPGLDEPLRVPIPFEIGFVFKALPEAFMDAAFGDERAANAARGIWKLALQSQPLTLPQAIKPAIEAKFGKSLFTGRDIESQYEKSKIASERTRDNTSYAAKLLSNDTFNISPVDIDYLINGYTGALGMVVVRTLSGAFEPQRIDEVSKKVIEAPTKRMSDMPLVGSLFASKDGNAMLDDAYRAITEFSQAKTTFNDLIKQGRRADAMEFMQKFEREIAMASTGEKVRKTLSQVSDMQRMIKMSDRLTPDEKRARLTELQKYKIDFARQFSAMVHSGTSP